MNGDLVLVRSIGDADSTMDAHDPFDYTLICIAALLGNEVALETLIKAGADLESMKSTNRRTALLCAASVGEFKAVSVLIKAGACLNTKNSYGEASLASAVKSRYEAVATVLVQAGADLEATDCYRTLL